MAPNYPERLRNQKVVVIGGSRGIGLAVAEAFISFGSHVVVVSSTQTSLDAAITLLKSEFPSSTEYIGGRTANVKDEASVSSLIESLASEGGVDHIVYTAVDKRIRGNIVNEDIEKDKELFGVKFWGQVSVAKAIAKYKAIKSGGSYTITGGSLSLKPKPETAVGAAINGAVNSLAKGLAVDLAPLGVRVNAVIPGFVRDVHEKLTPEREALYQRLSKGLLTGSVGTTEDIAETYLYFARAKYTTGTLALVDGGAIFSSA
ncbi:oxidoreductase [Sistotremastrum niveocremeum HHB9708]|uniref:Oxidoreductase n=1 Tax=Sistotremastrum niveocremeum HHB9708 TaxID=1314777 RepID=A0A164V5P8_9AGAM|nr:oxidoreductase [Sistotremastrum niveocremeum HHB9708]